MGQKGRTHLGHLAGDRPSPRGLPIPNGAAAQRRQNTLPTSQGDEMRRETQPGGKKLCGLPAKKTADSELKAASAAASPGQRRQHSPERCRLELVLRGHDWSD